MYHGIINVYKEKGFTSHDVVAKLRGITKQKKIGHTGTLDPDAEGVLPVCLGSATKLCDLLTDKEKEYVAVLRLGVTTDTQDLTGTILQEKPVTASDAEIRGIIASFCGEQMQIPPMYSALKVGGKKLVDLARAGIEVERQPRPITVHEIAVLDAKGTDYTIRVRCSKGTYIRTICHDIGCKLGCGGAMASLKRTASGMFRIEHAITLSQLQELNDEGNLARVIVPIESMFDSCPCLTVTSDGEKALLNGNQLKPEFLAQMPADGEKHIGMGTCVRVYDHCGRFCAIYEYRQDRNLFCPVKMFLDARES